VGFAFCKPADAIVSKIVLFFMFLNIQIDFIVLNTADEQFTLTTKKILAYHL